MKITNAKFRVVRPARPEGWTESQYEEWLTLPWWKRYELTLDWGVVIGAAVLGLLSALRHLLP